MEVEQVAVDPSPWSLGPVALPWLDVDDPRRIEPIVAQSGDECPGIPMAKRGMANQPLADRGPAGGLDEIGLQRGFATRTFGSSRKTSLSGMLRSSSVKRLIRGINRGTERLTLGPPEAPRLRHIRPPGFAGKQRFFYGSDRDGVASCPPRRDARRGHGRRPVLRGSGPTSGQGAHSATLWPVRQTPPACPTRDAPDAWAQVRPSPV